MKKLDRTCNIIFKNNKPIAHHHPIRPTNYSLDSESK